MIIYTNSIAQQIPNLDGFNNPDELLAVRESLKETRKHLNTALTALISYAEGKEMAMRSRIEGKIEQARIFEDACEKVYQTIPKEFRW